MILLDTCALIWLAIGGGELSSSTLTAIARAEFVFVSAISAFEVAHKYKKGGIELPCDPLKWYHDVLRHHDIAEIKIDGDLAIAATKLPDIHRDPCDRFIIATAMMNNMPVATGDKLFSKYGVTILP
jgi:PIN domain nuclease of toxin-antitoxin system